MKYLKIKNQGEITVEALELLGASTKRTNTEKIGMFGSGNKYALAYLLRNNYKVRVFGGKDEITISTVKKKLGETEFDVIVLNGKETSITTQLGKDWKLWQALREIYSNAMDEGQAEIELVNVIEQRESETHYYISVNPEIMEWLGNFDSYFSENKTVLFENKYGKILAKHNDKANIYRKGIKVYTSKSNSLYDYDFNDIAITEDRIVRYSWDIPEKIWKLLMSCTNEEIVENVILNSANEGLLENEIGSIATINTATISEVYKEKLKEKAVVVSKSMTGYLNDEERAKATVIPHEVFKAVKHIIGSDNLPSKLQYDENGVLYRETQFNNLQLATLDKVLDFFRETQYLGVFDYEIIIAIFDNKSIMGTVDKQNKRIIISTNTFEQGVSAVVETIIEEYVHLKYGVYDETRQMQDVLIRELVNVLKKQNAYLI